MTLRARLLLAIAVASLAALLVVDVATVVLLTRSQLRQVDDALTQSHQPVEQLVADGSPESLAAVGVIAPETLVVIVDGSGEVVNVAALSRRSEPEGVRVEDRVLLEVANRGRGAATVEESLGGDRVRLRIDRFADGRTLIIGQSLHELDEVRGELVRILVAATVAAIAVAMAIGAWSIRRGLKPLRLVEASAREITDGDLSEERVPGADRETEVGQLALSLNAMLDRLQTARDDREQTFRELQESEARMRRFVADASHELRTPVAATAAYAELFERGARDRPEDLSRAMTGIRRETDRMAGLIDDLMALARLEGEPQVEFSPVDLTEIVFAAVDAARLVAPDRPIRTVMPEVVEVRGDGSSLRQVIDNLLANVRAHTPSGAASEVALLIEGPDALLRVSDEGPGVTDSQLGQLFERFYRVDSSRTRENGGAGLGLSIVAAIVAAHGGSIEASQNDPNGLVVTVRLPNVIPGGHGLEAPEISDDPSEREGSS